MNKKLLTVSVLLAGVELSCSNHDYALTKPDQSAVASESVRVKPVMRHQPLPEGVISVDIVNSNNRLHLLTGKHHHGHKTLWYKVSEDGGTSWSAAVKILGADNIQANIVRGNDAQITAQNDTIVVAWMSYVEGAPFNAGPMVAARSVDAGKTWSEARSLGDESAVHADIAARDDGRIVVVWDMMGDDGLAVFSAQSIGSGASWAKAEQISKAGMRASHPRVVRTEKGFLTVWTEHDGRQQHLAMRRY